MTAQSPALCSNAPSTDVQETLADFSEDSGDELLDVLRQGERSEEAASRDELDTWLTQHDCLAPGVWGIGDLVS